MADATTFLDIIDTWYVVFTGARQPGQRWWSILTDPGFRHVWCYRRLTVNEEQSLLGLRLVAGLHATPEGVFIELMDGSPEKLSHALVANGEATDVLVVKCSRRHRRLSPLPGLLNCVSLVKAAIGLRAWWCWTPKLLYLILLRRGARSVLQEMSGYGGRRKRDIRGRQSAGA